ncbi:MAG: hypothetical protein ACTHKJ_07930, partial [Candidatus Nitrosocosmicus sp.]
YISHSKLGLNLLIRNAHSRNWQCARSVKDDIHRHLHPLTAQTINGFLKKFKNDKFLLIANTKKS